MLLKTFPLGPFATNTYLLIDQQTKMAIVVDAAEGSSIPIQQFLVENQITCSHFLLTHSHWDHIVDAKKMKAITQAIVCIHPNDLANLEQPGIDQIPTPMEISPCNADLLLNEDTVINVGPFSFQVIHTPGHSPGCVCFYDAKQRILFSGDTLFKRAIGSLSLPTSQPNLMSTSLQKLLKLPDDVVVYPGHGGPTSIGTERAFISRML